MANSKGPSSVRNTLYNGKNSLLPPKSPFPSISPSYTEYIPTSAIAPKTLPKPGDVNSHHHHQRTSSESFLIDEQPSWLDELLDEPETPIRKGAHRRSSSDSFAYNMDMANVGGMNYMVQNDPNRYNNTAVSWGSQDFDIYRDARQKGFYVGSNHFGRGRNMMWDPPAGGISRGLPSPRGNNTLAHNSGLSSTSQDSDKNLSLPVEKKDGVELVGHQDLKGSAEKKEGKSSETDNKRAKQQFAQRSRVRKLQYIAELERNVQALQAMEHEVLEREVARLRNLYQQQQQPHHHAQTTTSGHRRANSRDLDQQFSNLSLKNKEASRDSVSGQQLHM
ncbi:BZIP family transcription factor family protein [Striga asiatica]|uniref:BZIP family transcription factor family protein n=1 Tax=Striga asiatica TaxID=4170 RepID=A0A5A7QD87_STRAF|nr:BZIP family transcription factor family protein [Striga asiatica]